MHIVTMVELSGNIVLCFMLRQLLRHWTLIILCDYYLFILLKTSMPNLVA